MEALRAEGRIQRGFGEDSPRIPPRPSKGKEGGGICPPGSPPMRGGFVPLDPPEVSRRAPPIRTPRGKGPPRTVPPRGSPLEIPLGDRPGGSPQEIPQGDPPRDLHGVTQWISGSSGRVKQGFEHILTLIEKQFNTFTCRCRIVCCGNHDKA